MEKICWQITVAAFMQPLQYDLRDPAAKDNSITNAATARSNLDTAITMRSAETELQNTTELRTTASEIVAPKPDRPQSEKKTILKHFLKGFLEGKSLAPKWRKSADKSLWQPSCSHSNTIYEIQLQKTIVLPMQPQDEATLTQPLQCDLQRLSCKTQQNYAQRRRKLQLQNRISTPERKKDDFEALFKMIFRRKITSAKMEKICWQITVAATARSNLDATTRHCGNGPTVAKHNGIPSATHPPAPLAIPFTLQERPYSYKSQWNSVDRKCTKHRWNPIYNAEPIRPWSEHDPSTHETVSQPSHRRGRSSRFGDGLCMEKHRVSCICYLSKTHFVRNFLQNSIGNSSTSTTCNPIYSEGTILELQITMEFHRQLIHQHHLQSHLHCRNDPTVTNHNGILSTAMHETQVKPHLQCGTDPTMIRTWSEHDPTTHETVSQPSHSRGRSSRFGDGLCMEKHRVSCICYLSKTHFVRDFLQNSIGDSSTSTTCNPTLSLTNSFPH